MASRVALGARSSRGGRVYIAANQQWADITEGQGRQASLSRVEVGLYGSGDVSYCVRPLGYTERSIDQGCQDVSHITSSDRS